MSDKGVKIYENIQRLAYERGYTIQKLCEEAKVSAGTIGDLKHGRRNGIGNITIEKLVKVLGCTREEILSEGIWIDPLPDAPKADRLVSFIEEVTEALREREELRRLMRAAMSANKQQVRSTAILLESITQAQSEGISFEDNEQY